MGVNEVALLTGHDGESDVARPVNRAAAGYRRLVAVCRRLADVSLDRNDVAGEANHVSRHHTGGA